jgi:hypothetical protein
MMAKAFHIEKVHELLSRDERRYCFFSLTGSPYTFIYFSHETRSLMSLFYGNGFLERIRELPENSGICLECSIGTLIAGGVSLDGKDVVAFHCSIDNANLILVSLKEYLGKGCSWIKLFKNP